MAFLISAALSSNLRSNQNRACTLPPVSMTGILACSQNSHTPEKMLAEQPYSRENKVRVSFLPHPTAPELTKITW
ncbi:hypothetical protein BCY86_04940 [Pajaroellobacter abortibovis]|uniref:Uncharacterized protein n=1 Tax=Pajaroellobacter abortibovis TaxID=1882918 RepID=A0A1L6MX27_9BACT|nr:hypothetical protein BCY86_04940 [Pajaroellobacter abortibovis]